MPQKSSEELIQNQKFILIGEDDQDDREMLKDAFALLNESFVLLFVNSGKEILAALEKMEGNNLPSLIVLDYNMPELNGADILAELNKYPSFLAIPKLVWSTSKSDKFRQLCLELGAADYVIKPATTLGLNEIAEYMISLCRP